jgi:hypothetical protein
MKVGDKVLYEGKIATVINKVNPRCCCKGKSYYELNFEGYPKNHMHRVPLDTVLEPYKPLTMANQELKVHNLI